jgi:hypothetical protein
MNRTDTDTDTHASAAPRNRPEDRDRLRGDVRADHGADPTPADLLRGAADYLETHGWHQRAVYDRRGDSATPPACAMGALYLVAYGDLATADDVGYEVDLTPAVRDALRLLSAHVVDTTGRYPDHDFGEYQTVIGDWNDEDRRTITDVTAALRAAADTWHLVHGGAA